MSKDKNGKPRDAKGRFAKNETTNNQNGAAQSLPQLGSRWPVLNDRRIGEIVNNIKTMREIQRQLFDPRRNIDDECGYPDIIPTNDPVYRRLYAREPIAKRVVEVMPMESWQVQPSIFETEDAEQETEFEKAWLEVGNSLGGKSWFKSEEVNPIWQKLMRADIDSGIGSFGVLLLGIDDNLDLREPAVFGAKGRKLIFLSSFSEQQVTVAERETNKTNPRFGQPVAYDIQFVDPEQDHQQASGFSGPSQDITESRVHWTRVIHIEDNDGVPRMQPVYNRLYDLRKLYSGSAEMYWLAAFMGLSIETLPDTAVDVSFSESEKQQQRDQMEKFFNGLQRYIALQGMTAKSLAPQVADPTPQINTQIEAICIVIGIPKRIFTGSERGELASSQDSSSWNGRLSYRQNIYITPEIIVPFIDRLILLGILPEPTEGYNAVWPDLEALTDNEKAEIANKRTEAITKYVQGDGRSLIQETDFLTKIMGLTDEEAKAILEATFETIEKDEPQGRSPLLGLVGSITGMKDLFVARSQGAINDVELKAVIKFFFQVDDAKADELVEEGMAQQAMERLTTEGGGKEDASEQSQTKPGTVPRPS